VNIGASLPDRSEYSKSDASRTGEQSRVVLMESRMRWKSHVRFGGGGEETTGRKAGIGASPPTLRGVEQNRVLAEARSSPQQVPRYDAEDRSVSRSATPTGLVPAPAYRRERKRRRRRGPLSWRRSDASNRESGLRGNPGAGYGLSEID
jgi:hypothetical protein